MPLYHYDSRDHHQPLNRKKRFVIFVLVINLIVLALAAAHYYHNSWSEEGANKLEFWRIVAIVLTGLLLLSLAFSWFSQKMKWGYSDHQYLTVSKDRISWQITRKAQDQSIAVADIKYAKQDHRHLILKLNSGEERWLERYLLMDRDKVWDDFLAAVGQVVELK